VNGDVLTYFSLRLDPESVKMLETIAEKNGVPKSAIARNTLRLCLVEREEPSLVEDIIKKVRQERKNELFGRNEVKHSGDNGT
jgi:predicted DNA-binding protein